MAAPIRIGILDDMADGPPGQAAMAEWVHMAVADQRATGRIDRDIEVVDAYGLGLPEGTAAAVERAFQNLVDAGVLAVVGPAIGDNALVATPLADRYGMPTINWAGTERARSEWMFHLQVGSHEDESVVLARHLANAGARRVGVVFDRSPIGRRYKQYFDAEAEVLGMVVAASTSIAPLAASADDLVATVLDAQLDGLVYLGLGLCAPAVASAARTQGWEGPRVMNSAGLRGYVPEFGEVIDGWTYVDMRADDNRELAALRDRLGAGAAAGFRAATGHDLGRLVAEGIARAPELTRAGFKEGLERIKWLPAAEGHEGTTLGFGHHDRGALHGRYLVLRQWQAGRSVQV